MNPTLQVWYEVRWMLGQDVQRDVYSYPNPEEAIRRRKYFDDKSPFIVKVTRVEFFERVS